MSPELTYFSPGPVATDTIPLRSIDHRQIQSAIIRAADDLPNNELTMREFHVVSPVTEHGTEIRKHLIGGVTPRTADIYFAYSPHEREKTEIFHPSDFILRLSGSGHRNNQQVSISDFDTYWRKPLFDPKADLAWQQSGNLLMDETEIKLLVGALTGYRSYPKEKAQHPETSPLSVMIATARDLARTASQAEVFDTATSLLELPGILTTIRLSVLKERLRGDRRPYLNYELKVSNSMDSTVESVPRIGVNLLYSFARNALSPKLPPKQGKIKSKYPSWPGTARISVQLADNDFGPKASRNDTVMVLQGERTQYLGTQGLLAEKLVTALHHLESPDYYQQVS